MSMRDKIAVLLQDSYENDQTFEDAADTLLAALPGMVPELVWDEFGKECVRAESILGRYEIMWGWEDGQHALDVPKYARSTEWHPTLESAKAAANAHNAAAVCKALGL